MTGFGLASAEQGNLKISVEIKSLNSKFLELSIKLPKVFSDKELQLRNLCSKEIERGKVNIVISLERNNENQKGGRIDTELFKSYYQQLSTTANELGADTKGLIPAILTLPDVICYDEEQADESEWALLQKVFADALNNFQRFREDEGKNLKADLLLRLNNIIQYQEKVAELAPLRVPQIKNRLLQVLEENVGSANIDQNRLEQELIFYIDKLDITEEQTRLNSHCQYFRESLNHQEANGKKLGFIAQEMGREINTTGSKANDAEMQKHVVGMKEELEKIKEQLLNIL